jgi:uncharacterized membrane protein
MNNDGKNLLGHRFISSRPHLSLAIGVGLVVGLLMPHTESPLTRALIGWNAAVWLYLITMMWMVTRADHHKVREIACKQDENAGIVLLALVLCAVLSLSAIIWELGDIPHLKPDQRPIRYAFTALTVLGSWLVVGMLFTFHYAHMFYLSRERVRPLQFPAELNDPDYWDFLYFSFTIAVAAQTSDVIVQGRRIFNVAIIGLSINIAAGMLNQ